MTRSRRTRRNGRNGARTVAPPGQGARRHCRGSRTDRAMRPGGFAGAAGPRAPRSGERTDRLLDGAEHRAARGVDHLDPDPVAEAHERRGRLARQDRLDGALLGDAGIADPARGRRAAGTAVFLVRNRPGADDAARPRARASGRRARSASRKSNVMSTPAFGRPKSAPLRRETSGRWTLPSCHAPPSSSGVTATGEKAARGLRLEEPEALPQLRRNEIAQADVVDEHQQSDVAAGVGGLRRHRHVAGDDGDFGLEVDAPGFVGEQDVVARAQHVVGRALVHQRIGPELGRHRRAARAPHELDVVHVRRTIRPLDTPAAAAPSPSADRTARRPTGGRRRARPRSRRAPAPRGPSRRAPPAACARFPGRRRGARDRGKR